MRAIVPCTLLLFIGCRADIKDISANFDMYATSKFNSVVHSIESNSEVIGEEAGKATSKALAKSARFAVDAVAGDIAGQVVEEVCWDVYSSYCFC